MLYTILLTKYKWMNQAALACMVIIYMPVTVCIVKHYAHVYDVGLVLPMTHTVYNNCTIYVLHISTVDKL